LHPKSLKLSSFSDKAGFFHGLRWIFRQTMMCFAR
jgi:hypothetical protein